MPKFDITEFSRELHRAKVAPVYVLVGEEKFLAERALAMIIEKVCPKNQQQAQRSFVRLSGAEATLNRLSEQLSSYSLFEGMNLVVVSEAEKTSKSVWEGLVDYFNNPAGHSVLVIEASKLDGRGRFMQVASKSGVVVECKPLYQNKLPNWASIEAKRFGKQLSLDAAKYLSEIVGGNLGQLSQAVDRLSLYVGEKPLISLEDVEKVVAEIAQRTVFELTDAVGNKNWERSLKVLNNLLANNQPPLMILAMLARHMRILVKAKEFEKRGLPHGELATYLGVHQFFLDNYVSQARNFSSLELRRVFGLLSKADRKLKSSRLPPERILELTLRELCKK